ncbi:hypothetical protein [Stenotrophomonas cyclobalanopsidis]|uniref:hypothetical protein n=1 Tax=Stenotrophomonas cyclobalanopsidis TaxID=2771362 RepID=UPI00345F2267
MDLLNGFTYAWRGSSVEPSPCSAAFQRESRAWARLYKAQPRQRSRRVKAVAKPESTPTVDIFHPCWRWPAAQLDGTGDTRPAMWVLDEVTLK